MTQAKAQSTTRSFYDNRGSFAGSSVIIHQHIAEEVMTMIRILLTTAAAVAIAVPAQAIDWQCGQTQVVVTVNKSPSPVAYDVTFPVRQEAHDGTVTSPGKFIWHWTSPSAEPLATLDGEQCSVVEDQGPNHIR